MDKLTELKKKLAGLEAKAKDKGQQAGPHPRPASREERWRDTLGELTGCEPLGERGRVYVRDTLYPAEALHGNFPVAACKEFANSPARLLFSNELEGVDKPGQLVFLDTETTGMVDQPGTVAFMVGLGRWVEGGGFLVRQLFMGDRGSEPEMLERLRGELKRAELVVTYNGRTFDIPLLRGRYEEHASCFMGDEADPFLELPHLDLLPPSRKLWGGVFENCKLITLERELVDFHRKGDIPGYEIPRTYNDYLRRGPGEELAAVFTHNKWDIVSLAGILWAAGEAAAGNRKESGLGLGLMHAKAKRYKEACKELERADLSDLPPEKRKRALKELLTAQKKCEKWPEALLTAVDLAKATHHADPRPIEEAAIILERHLKNPQGASTFIEEALGKSVWFSKDRAKLEKRLARLKG